MKSHNFVTRNLIKKEQLIISNNSNSKRETINSNWKMPNLRKTADFETHYAKKRCQILNSVV